MPQTEILPKVLQPHISVTTEWVALGGGGRGGVTKEKQQQQQQQQKTVSLTVVSSGLPNYGHHIYEMAVVL